MYLLYVHLLIIGFNNFNGKTDILSLAVTGGNKDYAIVTTTVAFTNPSQITITIGDVNFSAKTSDGATIGQVFIKNTMIKSGVNQYNAEFRLAGDKTAIGKVFTAYLTNAQVPLTIVGTQQSTTIEPLIPALETVNLATTMKGIPANLVDSVKVKVTIGDLFKHKATSIVTLRNPLKTAYTLTGLNAKVFFPNGSGGDDFQVGHIDSIPEPCTVPAGGTTTCSPWEVAMDANTGQLLKLVTASDKSLNLKQDITSLVGGPNGYDASFYYFQNHVPTSLDVDLGLFDIPLGGSKTKLALPNNSPLSALAEQMSKGQSKWSLDKTTTKATTKNQNQNQKGNAPTSPNIGGNHFKLPLKI